MDPGDEASQILKVLEQAQVELGKPIQIRYLLHTHGHLDHIGATRPVREALGSQSPLIALHRHDEPLYLNLVTQGSLFGMKYDQPMPIDHFLEDGEELKVGELKLSVLHTPGHSPGSVCFRVHEDSALGVRESLLSGDTLFQGSVGRTDLWGANQETMFKSIRDRILVLDDETRVCPGHGPDTQVGIEKRENPFL